MAAAAKAIALGDHKRTLDDHASRVRHSFRAGMAKLGYEVPPDAEDDAMAGDVFVCGDITTQLAPEPAPAAARIPSAPAPVPAASVPASVATAAKSIWPYVLSAALGAGGLGAGVTAAVNSMGDKPAPPAIVQPATEAPHELRISSGDLEGEAK